jgi:hypothetical protein
VIVGDDRDVGATIVRLGGLRLLEAESEYPRVVHGEQDSGWLLRASRGEDRVQDRLGEIVEIDAWTGQVPAGMRKTTSTVNLVPSGGGGSGALG